MPDLTAKSGWPEPVSLAELGLPPTFVTDHCIRTLFYQGALSPVDLAKHWHVHADIAVEAVDNLKAAGLIEVESGHSTFERLGRVKLSGAGQAYAVQARTRTWYAGALPVSLSAFQSGTSGSLAPLTDRERVRTALAPFFLDEDAADEIGQAIAGGATLALDGPAPDEQPSLAAAIGHALGGSVTLPFSIYASGAVIRVFDRAAHRAISHEQQAEADGESEILRAHGVAESQWSEIQRPVLAVAGGLHETDVLPAYDEDARFYLAPTPFKASGGVLAIFDAASNPQALTDLARLWLVPGRHGSGIMMLRSGERIELPWHACTVLFGADHGAVPAPMRETLTYRIDVSRLPAEALRAFLAARLDDPEVFGDTGIEAVASALERWDVTRTSASQAVRYLWDRAAYEGEGFRITDTLAEQAAAFGCQTPAHPLRKVA